MEGLREARRKQGERSAEAVLTIAAADPLNLTGILVPGERVAAIPGRTVLFQRGAAVDSSAPETTAESTRAPEAKAIRKPVRSVAALLRETARPSAVRAGGAAQGSLGFFS